MWLLGVRVLASCWPLRPVCRLFQFAMYASGTKRTKAWRWAKTSVCCPNPELKLGQIRMGGRVEFSGVAGPGFEPGGRKSCGAKRRVPFIGIGFAVTRLRFPDRPQIFPVYATREFYR